MMIKMNIPKGIEIPDNWLIDTGVTTLWPYPEGIWVERKTELILRIAVVYHGLLDLSEAQRQLAACNDKFLTDNAHALLMFKNDIDKYGKAGKPMDMPLPFNKEYEEKKVLDNYRPWVVEWALGSEKMLEWVAGKNVFDTTFNSFGLNREQLRRLNDRLLEVGNKYKSTIPRPWNWVWPALLSGDYKRVESTKRELARRELQSKGFYRLRERSLLIGARYWIIVRILCVKQSTLLDELIKHTTKGDFKLTENDLSDRILRPFDEALKINRIPGRPIENKQDQYKNVLKN